MVLAQKKEVVRHLTSYGTEKSKETVKKTKKKVKEKVDIEEKHQQRNTNLVSFSTSFSIAYEKGVKKLSHGRVKARRRRGVFVEADGSSSFEKSSEKKGKERPLWRETNISKEL